MMKLRDRLHCIVGESKNHVIGNKGDLPWKIKEDLKNFRKLTIDSIVIMGRKTYDSLPVKKLDQRINIVLTRSGENKQIDEELYFCNIDECVKICEKHKKRKIFVIGGSEIYKRFMHDCKKIYMTKIEKEIEGDTYNPITDEYLEQNYDLIEESEEKESNGLIYKFNSYEKKS